MSEALKFALLLLDEVVPLAVRGIRGAVEALQSGRDAVALMVVEDRNPTAAEWSDLNAELEALRRQLRSD
ncbi:MAG: hypothetical protein QNJ30_12145 [Kiloniellales bacterium]|nr:hypothetical protein [Kiloniellales bacterium]